MVEAFFPRACPQRARSPSGSRIPLRGQRCAAHTRRSCRLNQKGEGFFAESKGCVPPLETLLLWGWRLRVTGYAVAGYTPRLCKFWVNQGVGSCRKPKVDSLVVGGPDRWEDHGRRGFGETSSSLLGRPIDEASTEFLWGRKFALIGCFMGPRL